MEHLKYLENIGEIDYNPVPPKRSELVTMRAQFKGRGKPLPYPLDEEGRLEEIEPENKNRNLINCRLRPSMRN